MHTTQELEILYNRNFNQLKCVAILRKRCETVIKGRLIFFQTLFSGPFAGYP